MSDTDYDAMTTTEAAHLMGLARQEFEGILDAGELPFQEVGGNRLVMLSDVMAYEKAGFSKRSKVFMLISKLNQELG